MIKDTMTRIRDRLENLSSEQTEEQEQLLNLLTTLEAEVLELAKTNKEHAESITHFANASAHEATRAPQDSMLMELSLRGLTNSIKEFEISHPILTRTVNRICQTLSSIGI